MKLSVKFTSRFKKDYKLILKRGLNINKLHEVVESIAQSEQLDAKYRDHSLSGNYANHRECHIEPDWLLIYRIHDSVLILELTRTGTHSDLFRS